LITYVGQSIKDNSLLPPSVVVSELLDTICDGFYPMGAVSDEANETPCAAMRGRLITVHPLNPFDTRYFDPGVPGLFSYSAPYLEAANATLQKAHDPVVFLAQTLPPAADDAPVISLDELTRFFAMPAAFFLKNRRGIYLDEKFDGIEDREPMDPDALEKYFLGSFLLDKGTAGDLMADYYPVVRATGTLPPGTAGRCFFTDVMDLAAPIHQALAVETALAPMAPVVVDLVLPGVRISGKIGDIRSHARVAATYARLSPRRKLVFWIEHLVLNCLDVEGLARESILIGRGQADCERMALPDLKDSAPVLLADLVKFYWLGQQAPLTFFPETSYAYALARLKADDAMAEQKAMTAAYGRWHTGFKGLPGESDNPYVRKAFEGKDPLEERGDDPEKIFSRTALVVFKPLIDVENQERNA
jgi:exodeoxyribonuclease V gamma subunit